MLDKIGPIATQAKLAMIGYGLLVSSLVILFIMTLRRSNVPLMVITIIATCASALIGIYSVNCMVFGSCHTLAWFVSSAITVVGSIYLLMVLGFGYVMLSSSKKRR